MPTNITLNFYLNKELFPP